MRVSKRPAATGFWKKQPPKQGVEAEWDKDAGNYKLYTQYGKDIAGDDVGVWFSYDMQPGEQVEVRMGVSFVSAENARLNLEAEQQGRSFDDIRAAARRTWNDDLGRIRVEGGTEAQKKVFYTGLYHALIHPNVLSDVNGEYPAMESAEIRTAEGNRYTVFSLWDTYRNLHQLLTLVYPDRQREMLRSMTGMYEEWGWLPKWELYGRETFTMEGDPAIPVIVDSWMKGLRDFDVAKATRRCASRPRARCAEPHAARHRPLYRERLYPAGVLRQGPCGRHLRLARAGVLHGRRCAVAAGRLARTRGRRASVPRPLVGL